MTLGGTIFAQAWTRIGPRFLPFADAATPELPVGRLLRLSLFQVSVGLAAALLIGTLNRVLIVELGVSAGLVAAMVSLPLLFAPFRALIGFRSDTHRSVLGWRRVPYIWFGSLMQFGGLAIMPFALILLSGDSNGPAWVANLSAALAFLLVGAGMHMVQTVGLALAADLAPTSSLPRVVALLSVMQLLGMLAAGLVFGALLMDFSQLRLIQVIQGAAVVTMILNIIALWKQEARDPSQTRGRGDGPGFRESWRQLHGTGPWKRRLVAVAFGTAGFSMQDVLLEPYGGQVLGLGVAATTTLTALFAFGGVIGFVGGARLLERNADAYRVAGAGALIGAMAFALVIFAAPMQSAAIFGFGTLAIGLGAGCFAHATLTAFMAAAPQGHVGLALGAWGAAQATAAGVAIALGGLLRDGIGALANTGELGAALITPATAYCTVYVIEIVLLFATLVALGPLVQWTRADQAGLPSRFGVAGSLTAP
jgi:BCD family chlorophyll transporter-like MFS transporter